MEQSEFNAFMENYEKEKNSKNEETDKIVNAVLEKLKNSKNGTEPDGDEKKPEPVNEEPAKEEKKPEPVNEEPAKEEKKPEPVNEEKPEEANSKNALPSEKLVSVFADHFGIRFSKTPTVKELAALNDIPYTSFSQALNALKKKSEELSANVASATNSDTKHTSIQDVLKEF